jgi:hypothetical protein
MMAKQGEWKYGHCIPESVEEAQESWKKNLECKDQTCSRANGLCQCCYRLAEYSAGLMHHRNGNKRDFQTKNLIWLCQYCYNQVNGIANLTIASLRSELT